MNKDFIDLVAWQQSHSLAIKVFNITKSLDKVREYSLKDHLRKTAISITSNIAEGFGRYSYREKVRFYFIAAGSINELKSQLILVNDLSFISNLDFEDTMKQLVSSHKLINALIRTSKRIAKVPVP